VKILIAPDSFKESLSAREVADSIEAGIMQYRSDLVCIKIPLADGGEGTVESVLASVGGEKIAVRVRDPLMREIDSSWGLLPDRKTAVIEMAAASGIELLSNPERNPRITTTYGTGQLMLSALDHGCTKIYLGIGGSATNDGGAGMGQALGARLVDKDNREIGPGGGQLSRISRIDTTDFDPRISDCDVVVLSDVENPLIGKNGASQVYGPQKGGDKAMIRELDNNLQHFGNLLESHFGRKIINIPGSGAAGGLGAGLLGFCNAQMSKGFETIADLVKLESIVKTVDLIITGEGKLDFQTKFGKVPYGVAQIAGKYGKKVIGIAGSLGDGYKDLYTLGFQSIFPIAEGPATLDYCLNHAGTLVRNTSERIIRTILIGYQV